MNVHNITGQQLRLMLENAHDGFFIHDEQGCIIDVNQSACLRLGYQYNELISASVFDIEVGIDNEELLKKVWPSLKHGDSIYKQGRHKTKDDVSFPVEISITCIEDGNVKLFFALARDITETINLKTHLNKLAMTDELTGTLNRRAFMSVFELAVNDTVINKTHLSYLTIDLDRFKNINDNYGHSAGDEVIKHFACVAQNVIRKEDNLGRVGGEEFGIVLSNASADLALDIAERIRFTIENSVVKYENFDIKYTVSIGVVTSTYNGLSRSQLIKNADAAMYQGKNSGRNCVIQY
jgi:diguanylate cyclase (GGDEF)-like protein/PAS domain S-box-containing protein